MSRGTRKPLWEFNAERHDPEIDRQGIAGPSGYEWWATWPGNYNRPLCTVYAQTREEAERKVKERLRDTPFETWEYYVTQRGSADSWFNGNNKGTEGIL